MTSEPEQVQPALTEPQRAVVGLLAGHDAAADPAAIARVVRTVDGSRVKQRRLAEALMANPSVLS